jgi:hypothetical protein
MLAILGRARGQVNAQSLLQEVHAVEKKLKTAFVAYPIDLESPTIQ